jgi:hypothetical protein
MVSHLSNVKSKIDAKADRIILRQYGTRDIVIAKVKGDIMAGHVISVYEANGYRLENMDTRKRSWRLATGLFTGQQIHTLMFRKVET